MITMIPLSKLKPHPDNPRRDLGDLTELSDSIRERGVLQNLTVVPWHDANPGEGITGEDYEDCYTVVIGHRRLSAAKLAGLMELPCTIVEMTREDQIATMMAENLQRADLTIYEQAQGFQMMLDLGLTPNDISEKTGFSKSTVAKRVKLLEFDRASFTSACERGGTLVDFAEVSKIKDETARNEVLESIGTNDFKFKLMRAIDKERDEAWKTAVLPKFKAIAKPLPDGERYSNKYEQVNTYTSHGGDDISLPDDADAVKYFYDCSPYAMGSITLYRAKPKAKRQEVPPEEKARREKVKALEAVSDVAQELRAKFVREFSIGSKRTSLTIITDAIVEHLHSSNWASWRGAGDVCEYLGISKKGDGDVKNLIEADLTTQQQLLAFLAVSCGDDNRNGYFSSYDGSHRENKNLDLLYSTLSELGYVMSDEEKQLWTGTHEIFGAKEDA